MQSNYYRNYLRKLIKYNFPEKKYHSPVPLEQKCHDWYLGQKHEINIESQNFQIFFIIMFFVVCFPVLKPFPFFILI
jgi:hypothetical protein